MECDDLNASSTPQVENRRLSLAAAWWCGRGPAREVSRRPRKAWRGSCGSVAATCPRLPGAATELAAV